jgi:hypothetical protein
MDCMQESNPRQAVLCRRHTSQLLLRSCVIRRAPVSCRLACGVLPLTFRPCLRCLCIRLTAPQPQHRTLPASCASSTHSVVSVVLAFTRCLCTRHRGKLYQGALRQPGLRVIAHCLRCAGTTHDHSRAHGSAPTVFSVAPGATYLWSMPLPARVCRPSTSSSARPANMSPTATLQQQWSGKRCATSWCGMYRRSGLPL